MIEFKSGREFIGVWFASSRVMDWMAAAWRDRADQPWQLAYRFRYYVDTKVHESEDLKRCYSGEAKPDISVEEIIETMNKMGRRMPGVSEANFLDMRGLGLDAQVTKLTNAPWSHVRTTAQGGAA